MIIEKDAKESFSFLQNEIDKAKLKNKVVISFLGFSGSGKGTQGIKLSKLFGIPHISLGDIIRHDLRKKTKIGWLLEIHDKHHFPEYIPEQIFIGLLIERISNEDCRQGFILDGFPRTNTQAKIMNHVILNKKDIHIPIFLDVSEKACLKRLEKRFICPSCGCQIGEYTSNDWPGYCPKDAKNNKMVKLVRRSEDNNPIDIDRRQRLIRENKASILATLEERNPLITIKTNNKIVPDEVFKRIISEIIVILRLHRKEIELIA